MLPRADSTIICNIKVYTLQLVIKLVHNNHMQPWSISENLCCWSYRIRQKKV